MFKPFNLFNIPRHIKKIALRSKINKNTNGVEKGHIILQLINVLIVLALIAAIVYLNYVYKNRVLLISSISALGIIILLIIGGIYRRNKLNNYNTVSKLILKDDDDRILDEWDISNNVSCLIGKKTKSNEVNINLSKAVYASLVSREHAVINKANNKWYFEDIGSSNGSGIKRKGESNKFKVEEGKPYEISSGDILYIANTKLYVK
ncbi:FHA domain-containing protein [Iocasia frigidifontis]|uniref:FHA domain-containing protein n=1 Tax=Iocasia fonsfrigidae TaxID=2682810 RepID=A0A8A7KLD9_9FIRM|nr:FHA domain-containing protein [Iocasia fonsfrigidae]QTL98662.1 FHA domain-containing protein [Iocasia fonsfrigidae]